MRQKLITIYPSIGDVFQVLILVPDTDDQSQIDEYVEKWMDQNMKNTVESYRIEDGACTVYDQIGTLTDKTQSEFEIYAPNPTMIIQDYFLMY